MSHDFKVGDHVRWNSEAGHVSGTIRKVHTADFDYKGHRHRASADDPQYEIKSDKTDRSEEHTSELQSLMRISYAVFCLKKKKNDLHITVEVTDPSITYISYTITSQSVLL